MHNYVEEKANQILSLWYNMNDSNNTGFLYHGSI